MRIAQKVLLDGGIGAGPAELLDVCGHMHRRHPRQVFQAPILASDSEDPHGFKVGAPGVWVADIDGEECQWPHVVGQRLKEDWQRDPKRKLLRSIELLYGVFMSMR